MNGERELVAQVINLLRYWKRERIQNTPQGVLGFALNWRRDFGRGRGTIMNKAGINFPAQLLL